MAFGLQDCFIPRERPDRLVESPARVGVSRIVPVSSRRIAQEATFPVKISPLAWCVMHAPVAQHFMLAEIAFTGPHTRLSRSADQKRRRASHANRVGHIQHAHEYPSLLHCC